MYSLLSQVPQYQPAQTHKIYLLKRLLKILQFVFDQMASRSQGKRFYQRPLHHLNSKNLTNLNHTYDVLYQFALFSIHIELILLTSFLWYFANSWPGSHTIPVLNTSYTAAFSGSHFCRSCRLDDIFTIITTFQGTTAATIVPSSSCLSPHPSQMPPSTYI